jgi:hypothetical protein
MTAASATLISATWRATSPTPVCADRHRWETYTSAPRQLIAQCFVPLCGARNVLTATFRCMQCGQDHLCRAHLNQQHYMCAICARQVEQEAAASTPQTRSQEPEFCPSCGGVIADDCFLCKKCEKINCGSCRDDRRRGWCVGCGEEHDRRQFEKTAQQQQKLEQLTLAIERSISTGELDDARHELSWQQTRGCRPTN